MPGGGGTIFAKAAGFAAQVTLPDGSAMSQGQWVGEWLRPAPLTTPEGLSAAGSATVASSRSSLDSPSPLHPCPPTRRRALASPPMRARHTCSESSSIRCPAQRCRQEPSTAANWATHCRRPCPGARWRGRGKRQERCRGRTPRAWPRARRCRSAGRPPEQGSRRREVPQTATTAALRDPPFGLGGCALQSQGRAMLPADAASVVDAAISAGKEVHALCGLRR